MEPATTSVWTLRCTRCNHLFDVELTLTERINLAAQKNCCPNCLHTPSVENTGTHGVSGCESSTEQSGSNHGYPTAKEIQALLSVGNKVSYPCLGPCLVGPVVKKVVDGKLTEVHHLTVLADRGGKLFVPANQARLRGIRRLLDRLEIPELLGHLRKTAGTAKNWKQRAIDNSKLFISGSAFDLANIVESLTELGETKALLPRDSRMLEKARRLLVCEIAEVMGEANGAAEKRVDTALKMKKPKAEVETGI